jgi:ABC-2 type transport system permease protein
MSSSQDGIDLRSDAESVLVEVLKLSAFLRRDFLVLWSYRLAFFSDWFSLILQVITFYFIGQLVDPSSVPQFGDQSTSYIQFVTVGLALTSFVQVAIVRLGAAVRNEQLMGTLESLLVTPAAPTTLLLGSVIYDLAYVPIRTTIFLLLASSLLGVDLVLGGLLPALAVTITFVPVVWGLGMATAAGTLTFRRGSITTFAVVALSLPSTTYFPAGVLPPWAVKIVELNPLSVALDATRSALLGRAGWENIGPAILKILPIGIVCLLLGFITFQLALRRERRRGTLGLY